VKFIVGAQLPLRLCKWLVNQVMDAMHTDDLPLKEFTPDIDIIKIATSQNS
jgi:predicted nuclease of predicted toxin-antitoxin system